MELNEFLGASATAVEAEEPAAVVEAPAIEAPVVTPESTERPRNERGQFVKADEPVTPTPPTTEERTHTVPVSALTEERRRRQEAEARLAALTANPPEDVKDEDFWNSPVEATQKIVGHQAQQLQAQVKSIKYDIAEDMTRSVHDDYDQVREQFVTRIQQGDPAIAAIAQQMDAQPNPAKFMYDQVKKLTAVESVGDLAAFEARIRAEERARVLNETGRRPPPQEVPRSLNAEPSAATPNDGQSFEQTPLENLVTFNF